MNIDRIIPADFRGCISIHQNDKMLFEKAYGYADLPNQVPMIWKPDLQQLLQERYL